MSDARPASAYTSPPGLSNPRSAFESKYLTNILQAIAAVTLTLAITWVAYAIHLNLAAASLVLQLVVLAVALKAGFWHATIVSIMANFCLDYFFIPPIFTFDITDPQNWVALVVFEISALVVSRLSTEAKHRAFEAMTRREEVERLYEFSQQLLLIEREQSLTRQILSIIQKVFVTEAGALFDASQPRVELLGDASPSLEADTRSAYQQDRDLPGEDGKTWIRVLRLGVRPIGAVALRGEGLAGVTVNALASLIAITLERAHSFARETRAEAERQSEQLRTTVLDALAHQYKTPLTAVRAATSGLMEIGHLNNAQSELITAIDSETRRLTELTTRLLQMSRLDRVDIRMRPELIDVEELILAVLSGAKAFVNRHSISVHGLDNGGSIRADRELVSMALTQFLDNAAKYSDPASTITVAAQASSDALLVSVHNFGPLIPPEDRKQIFERFYRSPGSQHRAAGTGIGLSISKKVAEAHGGRVWVTSKEKEGNTFYIELPKYRSERK